MRSVYYKSMTLTAIGGVIVFFFIFNSELYRSVKFAWLVEEPVVLSMKDWEFCGRNVTTKAIVSVRNAKALVVSAYLDERVAPSVLRIISIVDRSGWPQMFCHICSGSQLMTVKATVSVHPDHFDFPYGTADITCLLPSESRAVSSVSITAGQSLDPAGPLLQIRPVTRASSSAYPRRFSVCISTLFGNYSNVLQFVQAVEMYRILGGQKVFIYKSDCSPLLQRVLDYYSSEGLMEVIDWDITHHLKVSRSWKPSIDPGDLHYYGQIAALNDCVYRNMAESLYVLLNDIDEVVVPAQHHDWADMMNHLSSHHLGVESFFFEDSVFRHSVFGDGGMYDLWDPQFGVNILQHVHREPLRWMAFNACKMMVNPRAVVWTSVHKVLKQWGSSLWVPTSVARLQHCRSEDDRGVRDEQLIRDTTLWKYSSSLIRNVNRTLSQVLQRQQQKNELLSRP